MWVGEQSYSLASVEEASSEEAVSRNSAAFRAVQVVHTCVELGFKKLKTRRLLSRNWRQRVLIVIEVVHGPSKTLISILLIENLSPNL